MQLRAECVSHCGSCSVDSIPNTASYASTPRPVLRVPVTPDENNTNASTFRLFRGYPTRYCFLFYRLRLTASQVASFSLGSCAQFEAHNPKVGFFRSPSVSARHNIHIATYMQSVDGVQVGDNGLELQVSHPRTQIDSLRSITSIAPRARSTRLTRETV